MDLSTAIQIIDFYYKKPTTSEDYYEAIKVYFKQLYNVDLNKDDGSYKSLYEIFKESHENICHTTHIELSEDYYIRHIKYTKDRIKHSKNDFEKIQQQKN